MKTIAFTAALLIGTAALAQNTYPAPTQGGSDGTTTTTSMQEPMTAPGTMTDQGMNTQSGMTTPMSSTSYPRCSATVTDQCRQSSAREADYKGGPPANRRKRR